VVDVAREFGSKLQQPGWRVGAWAWLAFAVLVLAMICPEFSGQRFRS
jgi:hypothetical protein